jgi:hypothetical protein
MSDCGRFSSAPPRIAATLYGAIREKKIFFTKLPLRLFLARVLGACFGRLFCPIEGAYKL